MICKNNSNRCLYMFKSNYHRNNERAQNYGWLSRRRRMDVNDSIKKLPNGPHFQLCAVTNSYTAVIWAGSETVVSQRVCGMNEIIRLLYVKYQQREEEVQDILVRKYQLIRFSLPVRNKGNI